MDTRREFLKKASLLASGTSLWSSLPASIQKAFAINPDQDTTFEDAEHIVFLMQENRSFDHCFGTLQGVRGFNDPRFITLPDNDPVWLQANSKGQKFTPFRLNIKGLINIQFAIKDGKVYVIEANPRASRTTPFIAKAYQIPYLNIATKVMLGHNKLKDFTFNKNLKGYAIKEPVFSFDKFPGVNKELGPEMKSTGEAIRFIKDLKDPYFRQLYKDRSMYLSK